MPASRCIYDVWWCHGPGPLPRKVCGSCLGKPDPDPQAGVKKEGSK